MSTITVSDISLDRESPAQRLRRTAAAVRIQLRWWGVHRALTPQQREEIGSAAAADSRFLTAGKKLVDIRHEAFRRMTSIRTRLVNYWRGVTLPYTEPGVRLIRQSDIEAFVHALEGFRDELAAAEIDLNAVFEEIKADARRRLGRLYNPNDYPAEIRDLFRVTWDFPSVEPPSYLLRLAPELYEEERRRVASRFDEAVHLAEQAFATEFARLLSHLSSRLASGEDGERQVFRDSAVQNLTAFFARFADLNVRSNPELDALVAQAQSLVRGVTPQHLRVNDGLRQHVAAEMTRVQERVEGLLTEARGGVWCETVRRTTEVIMVLRVEPDGSVRCVYAEAIDLTSLGILTIRRASHVEADEQGRWWADLSPVGGPVLGPFALRSMALSAEASWLGERLAGMPAVDGTSHDPFGEPTWRGVNPEALPLPLRQGEPCR